MPALRMHKNEPFAHSPAFSPHQRMQVTLPLLCLALLLTLAAHRLHSLLIVIQFQTISTSRIVQPKLQLCFHRSSPGLVGSGGGAGWHTRGYQRKWSSNFLPSFGSTTCKVKIWTARQSLRLFFPLN